MTMLVIQRFQFTTLLFAGVAIAAISGCSENGATSDTPPPAAQTSEEIEQEISEQERLAAAQEKAELETERRIQRNRNAVNDLMFLGMTVAEANEALGVPGKKGLSIGGGDKEQENYEWTLEGGITITATFVNGKLDKKQMTE